MKNNVLHTCFATVLSVWLTSCNASDSMTESSVMNASSAGSDQRADPMASKYSQEDKTGELWSGPLPAMVLSSTDVYDRSDYQPAKISPGEYVAEVGGAILRIVVSEVSQGKFSALRIYREPGQPEDKKVYDDLVNVDKKLLGSSAVAEFVSDGLLWWEKESGNEFISSDLLLFLEEAK